MPYEIHLLTWPGALFLSLCALPQAIKAKRYPRSTRGLSWWFLWTWLAGEVLMLIGTCHLVSWPVLLNYVMNIWLIWYLLMVKTEQK